MSEKISLSILENKIAMLPESIRDHEAFGSFIQSVNNTFKKFERERVLIEHKHRISDMEFSEINRKLAETTNRLKLATQAAKIGVWEWNGLTGNVTWDDYMYEIFGVTDKEAFGKISSNWVKLTHHDDMGVVNKKLSSLSIDSTEVNIEFRIIRPSDGNTRNIISNGLISFDSRKQLSHIVGICMDVTDMRTTEKEKAKLFANILKQNKVLEDFAFVISHRLRAHSSKLSTVAGVFKNPAVDEALSKTLIAEVEKEAVLLDETLKELTEIVGLNEKKSVTTESINLNEAIDDVLQLLQFEVEECKAKVIVEVAKETKVKAVKNYLENVVHQLIENGIKFRSNERQLVIKIKTEETGGIVKLYVEDNGIGIDVKKHQNKLFGLYRKFHSHIEGKGIGLHLAKKQLELMDGKIEVESILNQGTTFIIQLQKDI